MYHVGYINMNTNPNTITICNINNKFVSLKLHTIEVLVMRCNGYANITKLCELEDKDFNSWKSFESSKLLLERLKEKIATGNKLILEVKSRYVKGEYISPEILHYVTPWISPYVAIKVSIMMRYYVYGEIINKETADEIMYGYIFENYVYKIYDKRTSDMKNIEKELNEIEKYIYKELTVYALEKADRILSRDYAISNSHDDDNTIELDTKINGLECELERMRNNYRLRMECIKQRHEEDRLAITSILLENDSYKEILSKVRQYVNTRFRNN